jgi:hypothetical protein
LCAINQHLKPITQHQAGVLVYYNATSSNFVLYSFQDIDNSSFEMVEEFKYLGTTLTNQNSIKEEIKSRLKSGNACYHSVQNLLYFGCYTKI